MRKSLLAALCLSSAALAQNSITVTATRSTNAAADLVVLNVDLLSPTDSSRDDVLAVLQGSIVTPANFSTVRTNYQVSTLGRQVESLDWSFSITAPLANFKTTLAQLQALQQIVLQKKNGMSLSFSIAGTRVSSQAQQGQTCAAVDLLSDARAQAQKMAVAAGAGVGSVLAISGAAVTQQGNGTLFGAPVSVPSCSITVKFALTGF